MFSFTVVISVSSRLFSVTIPSEIFIILIFDIFINLTIYINQKQNYDPNRDEWRHLASQEALSVGRDVFGFALRSFLFSSYLHFYHLFDTAEVRPLRCLSYLSAREWGGAGAAVAAALGTALLGSGNKGWRGWEQFNAVSVLVYIKPLLRIFRCRRVHRSEIAADNASAVDTASLCVCFTVYFFVLTVVFVRLFVDVFSFLPLWLCMFTRLAWLCIKLEVNVRAKASPKAGPKHDQSPCNSGVRMCYWMDAKLNPRKKN